MVSEYIKTNDGFKLLHKKTGPWSGAGLKIIMKNGLLPFFRALLLLQQ